MKYSETAKRLTEAMSDKNMKAVDLSNKTGLSKAIISQYVNGDRCPTVKSSDLLAEVLGVSPVWLMGFNVPKFRSEPECPSELYEINKRLSNEAKDRLLEYARFLSSKE